MPRGKNVDRTACEHQSLFFAPSCHANDVGYKRPSITERQRAASLDAESFSAPVLDDAVFPAPLVLPDDDLSIDPEYPAQSIQSWNTDKDRNIVTKERRTIYVASPPNVQHDVQFIQKWTKPRRISSREASIETPNIRPVIGYLQAFYQGLPVKVLPAKLSFSCWDKDDPGANSTYSKSGYIGLETSSTRIGIRTRAVSDGDYVQQLNLNDLLDVATELLPKDAYALLLLVDHDLFEDEEDEFVCGRAYGASRIAVISTARYNPALDQKQNVPQIHAWPASHCQKYLEACCTPLSSKVKSKKNSNTQSYSKMRDVTSNSETGKSPLHAAVSAYKSIAMSNPSSDASSLSALWLARCCRTASHELGHCFGMDHCIYYACVMQGSASIIEDARQPPYLCPIDLAKLLKSTGANKIERYRALLKFCDSQKDSHMFAAFGGWIRAILAAMQND